MQKLSSKKFLSALSAAARRARAPQYVTLELSYGCNLRCLHCFNPTHAASPRELSDAEIVRLLGELAALGALDVCLTGGEPLLRPGLFALIEAAKGLGLSVSLNTNATLVAPGRARRLKDLGVREVYASIYGATAAVYETVTGVPGSFARFQAGLAALAEARVPTTLQMPVMTVNRGEVLAARDLARSLGFKFLPTVDVYPRQDGDPAPLRWRLEPREKLAVLAELGSSAAPPRCAKDDPAFIDCDCGRTQFAVTPHGEMNLCTIFPTPRYDLRAGSAAAGWEALKRTVDEARPNERYECPSCDLRERCRQGRAEAWLETGDMSACLPHYRELARLENNENEPARSVR